MSADDDDPAGQNAAGDRLDADPFLDPIAELLYGLWQIEQSEIASAEPAAEANEYSSGTEVSE